MSKRGERFAKKPTLCWDCERAIDNNCPWVERAEPVDGWTAFKTVVRTNCQYLTDSYHVVACPMFKRDAERGGQKKYKSRLEYVPLGGEKNDKGACCNQRSATAPVGGVAESAGAGTVDGGNRSVAHQRDGRSWGALNHVKRDPIGLAYGIIARYALDWEALQYGERETALVDGLLITIEDTGTFFFSDWFEDLCMAISYSPRQIRRALRIPDDLIEVLLLKNYGMEAVCSYREKNMKKMSAGSTK